MVPKDTARIRAFVIQECPQCHTRIDVSRFEPLQEIDCPGCSKALSVKGNIDRFRLESVAGRGGGSLIYQAFDPHLGKRIALKVIRVDKLSEEAFQQLFADASATTRILHPQVARVHSVGGADGRMFIATEIISGGSLEDLLEKKGPLPEAQVLEFAIQVASGLDSAHRIGLVHRDLKPSNILFDQMRTAKVVGFGLSVLEQNAGPENMWGTPAYLPPERLEGQAEDFRADIYMLGATLFHALTGRPPFEGQDGATVAMKRLQAPAPSVPNVSQPTAFLLHKMMKREPDARFQSYQELIESLQFARGELFKPAGTTPVTAGAPRKNKAGMRMALAGVGVLLLAGSVAFFTRKSGDKPVAAVPASPAPEKTVEPPPEADTPSITPKLETPKEATASAAIPKTEPAKTAPPKAEAAPTVPPKAETTKDVVRAVGQPFIPLPAVYTLVNRTKRGVLECSPTTMTNGSEVTLSALTQAENQRWMIKKTADGGCRLLSYMTCKALDVRNGSDQDDAILSMWGPANVSAQRWFFREIEPGWYAIFSECSGKALTLTSSGGGQIGQREYTGKPEQQWHLDSLGALPEGIDVVDPVVTPKMQAADSVTFRTIAKVNPRYVPLDISKAATADSRNGMYSTITDKIGSPQPKQRGLLEVAGVPFYIVVPATEAAKDNITLKGGKGQCKEYAQRVEISVPNVPLSKLHVIGGVSGWAYPWNPSENPLGVGAAKITIQYQGGKTQQILLRNGLEFMDHQIPPGGAGVSGSARIEDLPVQPRQQLRYFAKPILEPQPVQKIVIESFDNHLAPTFFALTGEKR